MFSTELAGTLFINDCNTAWRVKNEKIRVQEANYALIIPLKKLLFLFEQVFALDPVSARDDRLLQFQHR